MNDETKFDGVQNQFLETWVDPLEFYKSQVDKYQQEYENLLKLQGTDFMIQLLEKFRDDVALDCMGFQAAAGRLLAYKKEMESILADCKFIISRGF